MSSEIIESSDGTFQLPIVRQRVARCMIDYSFSLEFHEGSEVVTVRIESNFEILEMGHAYRLTPSAPRELGPALNLFDQIVEAAVASARGTLTVVFQGGQVLSVEPDARYEAWEMYGSNGMHAVCVPGGGVSVWQPNR